MKKLSIISDQIKNNTYSYTGKGSFESIVKKHTNLILGWLEDLIPLQQQIDNLKDLEGLEFQKRNYTRILTKFLPNEYKEFVSLNILVRDANIIAQYYQDEYNITLLYDKLVLNKYLKYPGKYDKYVEFNIFQKFIMLYREDLISSLDTQNQKVQRVYEDIESEPILEIENIDDNIIYDEIVEKEEVKVEIKKETNWTNLLLGKLK